MTCFWGCKHRRCVYRGTITHKLWASRVPSQWRIIDRALPGELFWDEAQTGAHQERKVWLISEICCGQGRDLYCKCQKFSIPDILTPWEWLDLVALILISLQVEGSFILPWTECFRHNLNNLALLPIPMKLNRCSYSQTGSHSACSHWWVIPLGTHIRMKIVIMKWERSSG